ncbi:MAG: BPL-N domain-containing protein [Planctomycetia bacterium]|nr:BPL-N domain-containing protein [Planctomycetia bacterium]
MPNRTWNLILLTALLIVLSTPLCSPSFAQTPASCEDIRVAVFEGSGASAVCMWASYEILNEADGYQATLVSPEQIRGGALKDYDVVIFPGGTASGERNALGPEGWVELRQFISNGGGYLGVCAGAYMALVDSSRSEGRLINAELKEGAWERGDAVLEIELTDEGRQALGDVAGRFKIAYENGPIIQPANYSELTAFTTLAYFRTEIAKNNAPVGAQVDSPAIAYGAYGKGRVVISSPHPELTPSLKWMTPKLVKLAAQK